MKLQAGEYVSLAKVETALKMSSLIDNCCVYADSSKMFAICLVVPCPKQLKALAAGIGLKTDDWQTLCSNPEVEKALLKAIQKQGTSGNYFLLVVSLLCLVP